jgi:hypothetical protein
LSLWILDALETLQAWILRLTDSIVEVELSSKVPLAVVGVLTTDIISMESDKGLVWGHAGSPRVEKMHGKVKLGPRGGK